MFEREHPSRKTGTKDLIVATDLYSSEEGFSVQQMTELLGCTEGATRNAVATLVNYRVLFKDEETGLFKKPLTHWIHTRRLANPID